MRSCSSALLPLVISAAVALSMFSLGPLLTVPVLSLSLFLITGIPDLTAAAALLLRLGRSWPTVLAALSGTGSLIWLGTRATPGSTPLIGIPDLFINGFQVLRESRPPMPDHPALGWLLLFMAFVLQLVSYMPAESLEQPAWVIAPLTLPYNIAAPVYPAELGITGFLLVVGGYVAVLLTVGGSGLTGGGLGFQLARWIVDLITATAAMALTLGVTSVLPMGQKQPWLNNGIDKPIQLSDPTIELSRNLQCPSPVDVLTYRSSGQEPHYLRTTALTRLTTERAQLEPTRLRSSGIGGACDAPGEKVDVNVSVRFPPQYLPAPFAVDGFDAPRKWGFDQNALSVVATDDQGTDQTTNPDYRAISMIPGGGSSLPIARAGSDPAGGETLKVPEDISGGVRNLAARVAGNAATDGVRAKAIEECLTSDRFTYTLQAPSSTGVDAISAFLLNNRSGYCTHFVTSMAVLARIEDVPSRVAIGFMGGVPDGDDYEVTADNMHAWPELYFEGLGWVLFESTKSIGSPNTGENPPQSSPSPDPSVPPSTGAESPEPQPTEPTPALTPSPVPSPGDGAQGTGARSSGDWGWLLWGLPVFMLLASPAMMRLLIRGWRLRGGQPPASAAAAA